MTFVRVGRTDTIVRRLCFS